MWCSAIRTDRNEKKKKGEGGGLVRIKAHILTACRYGVSRYQQKKK